MNKQQWETIVTGVLDFNRLITTPEERKTEEYYIKCCNLLQEESDEGVAAAVARAEYYRNREGWNCTVDQLDAFADVIVTGLQCIDCVSPSQLEWGYVSKYLEEPIEICKGFKHTFLTPVVDAVLEAELEDCDIYGAMLEVIRSNNTKIPTLDSVMQYYGGGKELYESSVDEACHTAADWIESQLDYEYQITWKIVTDSNGVERVIFRDNNNKLRKPWCYKEPVLESYL